MKRTGERALFLRGMPVSLVREAKAIAARRGTKLSTVVAEALTHSLGVETGAPEDELAADMRWFERRRKDLAKRYGGAYLAIIDQAVIDHDRSFEMLATRVFAAYGNRIVYMPRAVRAPEEIRIRSPRLHA